MRSAIILVGGSATRAEGREKYLFQYRGRTFLEHLLQVLGGVTDEVILVAKDLDQCRQFASFTHVRCVHDIRPGLGPIGGLHAGVMVARGDRVFVAACDMPMIHADVVVLLFDLLDEYDAVVPCWDRERLEPLHAVYRTEVLRQYLQEVSSPSLRSMVRALHTRYVPVKEFQDLDPSLSTFTNINRLEDLEGLR